MLQIKTNLKIIPVFLANALPDFVSLHSGWNIQADDMAHMHQS